MLKLEKWDERLERMPNAVPCTEAMISNALDGTFMEWQQESASFRLKKVPRKFIKIYGATKYQNQFSQERAPVDRDKLIKLAEEVCRYMDDPLHVLWMRNHGTGARYTRSQKLFTLAGHDFLNASLEDLGAIMKRDKLGMRALHKAALDQKLGLQADLNEISARFMA